LLLLVRRYGLKLADHVLQEQEGTVVHAWQPGTKSAVETTFLMLSLDFLLLAFPVDTERWV